MHDKAIIVLTIGRECEGVLVLVLQDERQTINAEFHGHAGFKNLPREVVDPQGLW